MATLVLTPVMQEMADKAQELGRKLWKRTAKTNSSRVGARILTDKQFDNLTYDERTLIKQGWVCWNYCDYGIDPESYQDLRWRMIVKK